MNLDGFGEVAVTSGKIASAIGFMPYVLDFALRIAPSQKRGGIFYMHDQCVDGLHAFVLLPVGRMSADKQMRYMNLAPEKANRLLCCGDHVSSWQSRNPEIDQWGGAVRGNRYIRSFSGFPEALDEASMLLHALLCRDMTIDRAQQIARISRNEHIDKMLRQFDLWQAVKPHC